MMLARNVTAARPQGEQPPEPMRGARAGQAEGRAPVSAKKGQNMPTKSRKIRIKHVAWREGRPRFMPGKNLREKGYAGTDLRHPDGSKVAPADLVPGTKNDGAWFTIGEAMDWSQAFSRSLKAAAVQEAIAPKAKPGRATAPRGSYPVSRLIEDWKNTDAFKADLAEKTRQDYKQKMKVLEDRAPDIWGAEIDALDRAILYGVYDDLRQDPGLATARGVIRVLSSAITWGLNRGKFKILKANPALKLQMKSPPPRVRFATRRELAALIAVADFAGVPEMGDSFTLAVWSGQRQGDRLNLKHQARVKERIVLRQEKTGAIVAIPESPELVKRFRGARERRQAAGVVSAHMILSEKSWQPWNDHTYRHVFSEIRTIAANGLWQAEDGTLICPVNKSFKHLKHVRPGPKRGEGQGRELVAAVPSVADFWEMDFRDTAVTWLGLAGCSVPEICAITGHTLQSATIVLRHYLAQHPEMADSAISKMVAWYEGDGETELGF